MSLQDLISIFNRDLAKLKTDLSAYSNESEIWQTPEGISNSGGNLALHLIGNLNWFVGAQLGGTGYVRHRDLEFSSKDIPLEIMLKEIDATIAVVSNTLSSLSESDLQKRFPIDVFGKEMTAGYFLTHLVTHLAYHLGQINYHRRLLR